MLYIFLESSGKIQFNEDDPNNHDHHQEPQEDGRRPPSTSLPSMRTFLTTIFLLTTKVLNIFESLRQNTVYHDQNNKDYHQEPQDDGGHPHSMGGS